MGSWGIGSFENDAVLDWVITLAKGGDLTVVERTLDRVLQLDQDEIPSRAAAEAVGAAETVARLLGHWGASDSYTEMLDQWVREHPAEPPDALVRKATAALDRIGVAPSELLELWEESGDADEWKLAVAELRARISAETSGGSSK